MEARLCQGCARRPQGSAVTDSGLHASAIVAVARFAKKSILPYLAGESFFQKTPQLRPDRMQLTPILNRLCPQPGFIYDSCRWRESGPPALVITLHPVQAGSKPICSPAETGTTPCGPENLPLSPVGAAGFPLRESLCMPNLQGESRNLPWAVGKSHLTSPTPGSWPPGVNGWLEGTGPLHNQLGHGLPRGENGGRLGTRTS